METIGRVRVGERRPARHRRLARPRRQHRHLEAADRRSPPCTGRERDGDDQADRRVHGGPTKAIYAYGAEDDAWWGTVLGVVLQPGTFGENLTISGVRRADCAVGERWRIGSALLRVTEPRIPRSKLGLRTGHANFRQAPSPTPPGGHLPGDRRGRGSLGATDPIEAVHRPDHEVTIGMVERAYHGTSGAARTPPRCRRALRGVAQLGRTLSRSTGVDLLSGSNVDGIDLSRLAEWQSSRRRSGLIWAGSVPGGIRPGSARSPPRSVARSGLVEVTVTKCDQDRRRRTGTRPCPSDGGCTTSSDEIARLGVRQLRQGRHASASSRTWYSIDDASGLMFQRTSPTSSRTPGTVCPLVRSTRVVCSRGVSMRR